MLKKHRAGRYSELLSASVIFSLFWNRTPHCILCIIYGHGLYVIVSVVEVRTVYRPYMLAKIVFVFPWDSYISHTSNVFVLFTDLWPKVLLYSLNCINYRPLFLVVL